MSPETIEGAVILLGYMAVLMLILGIGGFVADYIFPLIPPLERWINSLPELEDDEAAYQEFLAERRDRKEARHRRRTEGRRAR